MGAYDEESKAAKMAKDMAKKTVKKAAKEAGKSILRSAISFVIANIVTIIQVIAGILAIMLVINIFQYAFELITAEKTPEQIYETLEVEDMKELIQIVGNDSSGYHLEFVDDIDDKIYKIIDVLGSKSGMYVINEKDSDILKKMILAEAYTQFPNLGGNYNEENEEFQGAVKVRRVTPNKEIGEMKNTGTGEVTTLGNEKEEDVIEDKKSSPTVKSGAELIVEENSDLYVKGTYDENGEKTSDSGVTLAKEALNNNTLFSTGKILYYTGQYIVHEDNTYFEVKEEKDGQAKGYINASTIRVKTNGGNKVNNSGTGSDVIGDENKEYVLAIAAGHNSTDDTGAASGEFIEQDMTIKVAEKVEELCSKYSNLKVVQTGSTSENPGGVGMRDRVQLAKEANPDLCIQIHFNAGGGTGVEAWYEYGDGYSAALAEILSNHMSEKMGLENRGAQTKENNSQYWAIIDSYSQTNFPSVITEGGFLDNATDQEVLRSNGIDKYAEAIVEGCIEYLTSDHSDLNSTFVESVTEASGIESKVYDLKYKDPADFEKLVNEDSKEALNYYTLDDSFNIITATWSYDGNSIDINTNAPVDFRTTLQNVTMPYEYLLYFLIDSGNKNFVRELSDMVADSEIVMAVQDDVTTTDINATVQQRKNANIDDYDTKWSTNDSRSIEESSFSETCRTSVSITYADVWCARYSKTNDSYSAHSLGIEKDDTVNTTINVRGSVKEQRDTDIKDAHAITDTQSGTDSKQVIGKYGTPETKTIEYTYVIEEKYTKSIHIISNSYEEGEPVVDEKINKFINLYKEHKMANSVKEKWLFQILEKNSKTANMVDLTKYLIYRATGTSYGVEEFDFEEYSFNSLITIGGIYGGTIQEKVWFTLTEAGFSEYAVAGVMGNIEAESGFNCTLVEYGYTENNGGIGLCQWTNGGRGTTGRNQQLKLYAASKGVTWQDENTQVEFLLGEITRGGGANGYASYGLLSYKGYSPSDWENAQSPTEAAIAFCWTFERPGIPRMEVRTVAAEKYYKEFHGKKRSAGGSLLQAADAVAQYVESNLYQYLGAESGGYTFPIANRPSKKIISCSSYIQEVLLQAGYTQCAGSHRIYARKDAALSKRDFESVGIQVDIITDLSQIQPGDILQYTTGYHVVLAYSVSGDNITIKGVPEVLSPNAGGQYSGYGANGVVRGRGYLQSKGCYIVRIKN